METFVPIKGYPNYWIANTGRVMVIDSIVQRTGRNGKEHFFTRKGRFLTPKVRGLYHAVHLYNGKVKKMHSIHRLVAEAFIPNPENLPQVNHKDEDKFNNRLENLEWCTSQHNQTYSKSKEYTFISPAGEEVKVFGLKQFCRDRNLNVCCIHRVLKGIQKQTKGWRLKSSH